MPELILFSFIALLIGGMLWSDRDSRYEKEYCYDCGAWYWTRRYQPIKGANVTPTPYTKMMIDLFTQSPHSFKSMFDSSLLIDNEKVDINIVRGISVENDALDSFMYGATSGKKEREFSGESPLTGQMQNITIKECEKVKLPDVTFE